MGRRDSNRNKQKPTKNNNELLLRTVNIRIPREVIAIIDRLVAKGLFANRSEAVREFCRDYLREKEYFSRKEPKNHELILRQKSYQKQKNNQKRGDPIE